MQLNKLIDFYKKNNLGYENQRKAVDLIIDANSQVDWDIDTITPEMLDEIIQYFVRTGESTVETFLVLMRYFKVIGRDDLYIHLTRYTGMIGVLENIIKRLRRVVGNEKAHDIIHDYNLPHLGITPEKLPEYSAELMRLLEENLDLETVEKVVTGNNHDIPEEAMMSEKVEYENAASLDEYLKGRHARKVKELQECLDADKVWYEQRITKEVVDFVKGNQEILSAVLADEKLYITKIPYDPENFLKSNDKEEKRYLACHCPYVRESIREGEPKISGRFCYCSAGFAKFPFEVILGQKLNIKVLESVLDGSDRCRFEIDLKGIDYKK